MPRRSLQFFGCLLIAAWVPLHAADWPHWRGPSRDGRVEEDSGWNGSAWPMQEVWRRNVGQGSTSPLVIGDRLYTLGWRDGRDTVLCLQARTGEAVWEQTYPAPRHARNAVGDEGLYFGPTSTPEYDSETGLLYTLGCDGALHCFDTRRDGALVWAVNLYDEYKMPKRPGQGERHRNRRDYGYTTAPCVKGDWLIVEVGAPSGTVRALDKRTGKPVWASQYDNFAGHTGGLVPLAIDEAECLAVQTQHNLLILRVDGENAGRTVATFPWEADFANNILTPVAEGNRVLVSSCYSHRTEDRHASCQVRIADGKAEVVWEKPYSSFIGSPVLVGTRLYIPGVRLYCLDWTSGELVWEGANFNYGASLIACRDERLIALGNRGNLLLIESDARSRGKYVELASREVLPGNDIWSHAVLSGGSLYARDVAGNLLCLRAGD